MIQNFIIGFKYLFRGFGLIKRSGLRRFFILPVLINVIIFSLLIYLGLGQVEELSNRFIPESDSWWFGAIVTVLKLLFWLTAMIVMFFSFTLVANLIASPFNSLLAKKVELHVSGAIQEKSNGILGVAADFGKAMMAELQKYFYFLIIALLGLVITLFPATAFISPFFWSVFTAWMLVLEYVAYGMDNNGQRFKEVRVLTRQHRWMALGFGSATMLVTAIPLVNLLVMPAAVAGATVMWVEKWRK